MAISPAVLRACTILDLMASRPSERFSVSDLARTLAMPRSTCDTIVSALSASGFLRRDDDLFYVLGPSCLVVGDAVRVADPTLRAASEQANQLARQLACATAVSICDHDVLRTFDTFDYGPAFGFKGRVGDTIRFVPPFGAAFAAWAGTEALQAWWDRSDPPLNALEIAYYRRALDVVRRRGYSVVSAQHDLLAAAFERIRTDLDASTSDEQTVSALRRVTHSECLLGDIAADAVLPITQMVAPVFEPDGRVGAVIVLLGRPSAVTASQISELGEALLEAAAAATMAVRGGNPSKPSATSRQG